MNKLIQRGKNINKRKNKNLQLILIYEQLAKHTFYMRLTKSFLNDVLNPSVI